MSMLGEVLGSLGSMSQLQLLFAFIACAGYAFALGSILPRRGRRISAGLAVAAAIGFGIECQSWPLATILLGFGIVGMASFAAVVWLMSRLLGFGSRPVTATVDSVFADSGPSSQPEPRLSGQPTGPAHFV